MHSKPSLEAARSWYSPIWANPCIAAFNPTNFAAVSLGLSLKLHLHKSGCDWLIIRRLTIIYQNAIVIFMQSFGNILTLLNWASSTEVHVQVTDNEWLLYTEDTFSEIIPHRILTFMAEFSYLATWYRHSRRRTKFVIEQHAVYWPADRPIQSSREEVYWMCAAVQLSDVCWVSLPGDLWTCTCTIENWVDGDVSSKADSSTIFEGPS